MERPLRLNSQLTLPAIEALRFASGDEELRSQLYAGLDESKTKIGCEISFTRHFYKPQPLRTLEEIRADILAVEQETEGLLDDLLKGGTT
jgi:hypothetical protein